MYRLILGFNKKNMIAYMVFGMSSAQLSYF
jgi:hypothetical protein